MRPVASAVAVFAATASLVLVSACSSAEDAATDGDETTTVETTPVDTTPEETTAGSTTASTTEESDAIEQPTDGRVGGSGFTVGLPEGWEDVSEEAAANQSLVDIAIAAPSGTFRTNFNVVQPQPFSGTTEELVKQSASELRSVTKTKVTAVAATDFDGVSAPGQTSSLDTEAGDVTLIQYMVVRGGQVHPVTMTFLTEQTSESTAEMDEIIASWQWE